MRSRETSFAPSLYRVSTDTLIQSTTVLCDIFPGQCHTVISNFAITRIILNPFYNQGRALLVAENRKLATHAPACQAAGISFIPLVIESLGGLSDATNETISSALRTSSSARIFPPSFPKTCCIPMEGECDSLDSSMSSSRSIH